jgi:hypothetical protein
LSHGFVELPPMRLDEDVPLLELTLALNGKARTIEIGPGKRGRARVTVLGRAPSGRTADELVARVRHVLALDEDLSDFYELVAGDPDLAWASTGRRPDAAGSERLRGCDQDNLHHQHRVVGDAANGDGARHEPGRRGAGRAPRLPDRGGDGRCRRALLQGGRPLRLPGSLLPRDRGRCGAGRLDLEALLDPEVPDDEVEARLLALPGVGPYATAQILMLLGRYSRLILDSWSRPKYAQLNGRKASDKTIERRFRRYKRYAGLAFWLYVTRDWVAEPAGIK